MLNITKSKLDAVILDYPEYSREIIKLKPLLEIATCLSSERVVNFVLVRQMVEEVRVRIRVLEVLEQFN